MDDMIDFVLTEQLRLHKLKLKDTSTYKILNILKSMIENIDSYPENDRELTSYRQCAKVLDYLFQGTKLKLLDGEPGCFAVKEEVITNHSLYPVSEENALSTCSIRKIDATVASEVKKERIELSINEWKKDHISMCTIIKQQFKNLRSNLAILNQLNRKYKIDTKNALAMDFATLGTCTQ